MQTTAAPTALVEGRVSIETITPNRAAQWLAKSEGMNFREPMKAHVTNLAAQMRNGEWRVTGSTICLDKQERIVDGQHRCLAVVESGATIRSLVLRDVNRDIVDPYIDMAHRGRSTAQFAQRAGYNNPKSLAAALRLYWCWERGQRGGRASGGGTTGYTPGESAKMLLQHGAIGSELAPFADRTHPYCIRSQALFLGLWVVTHMVDPEKFKSFSDAIHSGESLQQGNPILALRNYAGPKGSLMKAKLSTTISLCNMISAWNAYIENRPMIRVAGMISYSRHGVAPEISLG